MNIDRFDQLIVWRLGMDIADEIFQTTKAFPKEELYGLTSQIRRAAISIPSNIAEGFNRHKKGDFKRFLDYSLGSCGEVQTQIHLSFRFKYINEMIFNKLISMLEKEQKMLKSLIHRLKQTTDCGLRTEQ
ncbi:hypothetical protein BVX98_06875 [bacterium F11]|nr:hypothetical protein BVX98_06875 [bacterium F11]